MSAPSNIKLKQRAIRADWQPPIPIPSPNLAIDVEKDKCTGCNLCILACPTNVLALDEGVKVAYVVRLDTCIVCRSCEVVCRPNCIHVQLGAPA